MLTAVNTRGSFPCKRIKECTGLSYGQLNKAAEAGVHEGHDPGLIEGLKPAWGARKDVGAHHAALPDGVVTHRS